ncbi:hypothetical protein HYH02_013013 [Chlamydomonas schloesseri]|uniref:Anaphase-promoting complex subunit 4 WD40 domain-containing protein n=1 Tax=Chlamydomonas schloesseri TaxID=2026947 RepID=A0A835T5Y8_9CHLO|nr:hypothetical protein HYH02_013013 [Chlamydomonas schloesseri]|eukprot:KAG2432290.1 hypothetical protein HYH02_013013 [Chlamydomonas schloesseri]
MFDWKPSAVVAIAPCPGAPLFAVGYECGSLELWDMLQLVCTQTVAGPSLELTSLAWARDSVSNTWRTFAAFLDGTIAEVLWRQASVAHSLDSYGGVVWALAAAPVACVRPGFAHVLAAACDDGSVRLFGCEGGEPGLVAERVLARLEGRLLCAAWHAGGTALAVAGTSGNIHVLDAMSGREQLRITASPSATRAVTVWRLLSLPDGTLVSGDSDGAVQMWDGRFGTQLARFNQHRADVLALAATEDGSAVFAAGVDSRVAQFARVAGSAPGQPDGWAYTHYKRPHTHDVRALALLAMPGVGRGERAERGERGGGGSGGNANAVLLSGGVDAQLMAYPAQTFLQEHPHRLSKCPQRPACQATSARGAAGAGVAAHAARLMVAQHDTIDVWQLAEAADAAASVSAAVAAARHHHQTGPRGGAAAQPASSSAAQLPPPGHVAEGEPLELLSAPRHLARIRTKGARVAAAAMSPSGGFVAAATPAGARAYAIEGGAVSRLRLAPAAEEAAAIGVAATDSHVVLALPDGGLLACSLPDGAVAARAQPRAAGPAAAASAGPQWTADDCAWRNHCPPAASLVASADGSLLAAVGCAGISLHKLPSLEPHGRVLKAEGGLAFTAAAFSRDGRLLAATTSSCALLVWDTSDCRQLAWCADNADAATAAISRLPGAPTAISFCPSAAAPAAAPAAAATAPSATAPPAPSYRLVVNSPGGLVHFDLGRPLDGTAHLDAAASSRRHARGRLRPEQRQAAAEDRPESRGGNGRVIRTLHPAVWVGHLGASDLLLLEKPWEEVLADLPPPLLTHVYGS